MYLKSILSITIVSVLFMSTSYASEEKQQDDESDKKPTKQLEQIKRDAASGLATGKRDAASGLPSGKRQHKPISVTKPIDKSTPYMKKAANSSETKTSYRLCPDGTKINPGEKCPEKKSKKHYKICPDGSKVNSTKKCPK